MWQPCSTNASCILTWSVCNRDLKRQSVLQPLPDAFEFSSTSYYQDAAVHLSLHFITFCKWQKHVWWLCITNMSRREWPGYRCICDEPQQIYLGMSHQVKTDNRRPMLKSGRSQAKRKPNYGIGWNQDEQHSTDSRECWKRLSSCNGVVMAENYGDNGRVKCDTLV